MISGADFPHVFPWMAERVNGKTAAGPHSSRDRKTATNYDPCIARWEDDGGEIRHPDAWQTSSAIEARQ